MQQPLAVGAASGTASAGLALALLRQFLQAPAALEPARSLISDLLLEPEKSGWVHAPSVCLGILVGLSVGPILDLVWVFKQRRRQHILAGASETSAGKPRHRVLA